MYCYLCMCVYVFVCVCDTARRCFDRDSHGRGRHTHTHTHLHTHTHTQIRSYDFHAGTHNHLLSKVAMVGSIMNFKLSDDLEQNIRVLVGIMDGGMG
jgi:hypothetical protein